MEEYVIEIKPFHSLRLLDQESKVISTFLNLEKEPIKVNILDFNCQYSARYFVKIDYKGIFIQTEAWRYRIEDVSYKC